MILGKTKHIKIGFQIAPKSIINSPIQSEERIRETSSFSSPQRSSFNMLFSPRNEPPADAILGSNLYLIKQVSGPGLSLSQGPSSPGLVCALGFIRLLKP